MQLRPFRANDISNMASVQVAGDLEDPLAKYLVKAGSITALRTIYRIT